MHLATLPVLLSILISLVVPHSANVSHTNNRRAQDTETVIFSVTKYAEQPTVDIEPIVIMRAGKYVQPPVEGEAVVVTQKFTDTYFKPGRRYRMVFGGGDAGSLTVVKQNELGCVGLTAEVRTETTARLGGQVKALAVSSETIGKGENSRRTPTEEERAETLALARGIYAQRRVSPALIKKMNTVNLTATDIERDGKFELIGSFEIRAANYVAYNLFVIFDPTTAGKYKAAMTWYKKGGEADFEHRSLIDVIDLDGDGTAEVIVGGSYYESNDYVIYKRQAGAWRSIYQGGGGGC